MLRRTPHAPSGADLANTLLSVSIDHRDLKCHPSTGGNYTVRVEYTARSGRTHETKTESRYIDGAGWKGVLDYDFDVPYSTIKPSSTVTVFMKAGYDPERFESFAYRPSSRREVASNGIVEDRSVEAVRRQGHPVCN
ncbi:hypothetical protein PG984_010341 [Apiospora sp. TS-2023a]